MKRKATVIALAISFCGAVSGFGKTTTNTLTFSSSGFAASDGIITIADGILGAGFRSITCPQDTGFYWGSDLTLGIPTTAYYNDPFYGWMGTSSTDDLFMSLKVPLGYRFPATGRSMGFFIGGGAALQMVVDWDTAALYGVGPFAELGFQTNKTSGIGFHIAFQLGLSPLVFSPGNGTLSGVSASEASLRLGMSWRRERP